MEESTAKAFLDELAKIAAQDKEAFGSRGQMAKAVAEEAGTVGSSMLGRLLPGSRGAMERAVMQSADETARALPKAPKGWMQRATEWIKGVTPKPPAGAAAPAAPAAVEQAARQGLTSGQKAAIVAVPAAGATGVVAGQQLTQPTAAPPQMPPRMAYQRRPVMYRAAM